MNVPVTKKRSTRSARDSPQQEHNHTSVREPEK